MMRCLRILVCAVIATALAASPASAQVTVYTNQGAFLAAVNAGSYTETFNSFPLASVPSPINLSGGAFAYNATASTSTFFMAGSAADVWLSTNIATDTVTFNFTSGNITAVGGFFFTSDVGGNAAAGDVTLTPVGGTPQIITASTPTSFIGFTSVTPLSTLTLSAIQPAVGFVWPTANDLTVGAAAAVPEPTSLVLLGVPAVGSMIWRRKRAKVAAI